MLDLQVARKRKNDQFERAVLRALVKYSRFSAILLSQKEADDIVEFG